MYFFLKDNFVSRWLLGDQAKPTEQSIGIIKVFIELIGLSCKQTVKAFNKALNEFNQNQNFWGIKIYGLSYF